MGDKNEKGFDIGFSDEEKEDLERMIGAFNDDRKTLALDPSDENLIQQMETIREHFIQIGKIIAKTNKRLDSFYEIIQLMYRKSEIMNDRLNMLISALEKDADIITE